MEKDKIVLTKVDMARLEQARMFIQENLSRRHTLNEIAGKIGMNRYKLTYGFRKMFGTTLHQFLIKARMENAKRMLLATDHPVKAIAAENGYVDTKNFLTAFKKYTGLTPTMFKRSAGQ